MFKFKNDRGRLVSLEPAMKKHLYTAAVKEMEELEKYLDFIKKENVYLQTIFAED